LAFFESESEKIFLEKELCSEWESALIIKDEIKIAPLAKKLFTSKTPFKFLLKGTDFQLERWRLLLQKIKLLISFLVIE